MVRLSLTRLTGALASLFLGAAPATADAVRPPADGAVRFATFNVSLYRERKGDLRAALEAGWPKAAATAEVIQRVRPDVLVLQEFDRDATGDTLDLYVERYLSVGRNGAAPIAYPHRVVLPSNTGVASGIDLDGDGTVGARGRAYARDALGFGAFPGQYAFAVLSRHPVRQVRTFTDLKWAAMPDSRLPPDTPKAVREVLPLPSKTHALVAIETPGGPITVVAAHPTPPIVTARNVARNADEIRLAVDLLSAATSSYAVDDDGVAGGLARGTPAVVLGDLNADPVDGSSAEGAIAQLLESRRVQALAPEGAGGTKTAAFDAFDLRVDYAIPTADLAVTGTGVHWLPDDDPNARLNAASDHFLVWVDVQPAP